MTLFTTTSRRHRSARSWIAIASATTLVASVLTAVGVATPVTAASVDSAATLRAALDTACVPGDTVTLTGDIAEPSGSFAVTCDDMTLDLAGFDLTVADIELAESGVSFTLTDTTASTTNAGTLTAAATGPDAAIKNLAGSALTVSGTAIVSATGGDNAAGIGGDAGGAGGDVTISGSATVTTSGGTQAAGIGGGASGNGGALTVSDDAVVTVSGDRGVGAGAGGTAFGSVTLRDDSTLRITSGVIDVTDTNTAAGAAGAEIVVESGASIEGSPGGSPTFGEITGDGQIANAGSITLPASNIGVSVFDRHYSVTFDNGPSADADPGDVTVFARRFTSGDRTFPPNPSTPAGIGFLEWNTSADGTGTRVRSTTTLPGSSVDGAGVDVALFAIYAFADPDLRITGTAVAGGELTAQFDPQDAGTSVSYQWQEVDGATVTDIAGANQNSYTATSAQRGLVLRVRVTRSHPGFPDSVKTADSDAVGSQTITFTSTAPNPLPADTYDVTATGGGSGNPVTITLAPESALVCSLLGSTITFTGFGDCLILADQVGDADYDPATRATQRVTVLDRALNGSCAPGSTITLSGDVYRPQRVFLVHCDGMTLDLAGSDMAVSTLKLTEDGVDFTITDSTVVKADAGTLVADAGTLESGIANTAEISSSDGSRFNVSSLTISGTANVEATGVNGAAGIGGGGRDDNGTFSGPRHAGDLIITDEATVTAVGGTQAAAIGGGAGSGDSGDILISGSATVVAASGLQGSGIGTGSLGDQTGIITITDNAVVTVTGRSGGGSAIGGGAGGDAGVVNISGDAVVTATGSGSGKAIGGGASGATLTISDSAVVTAAGTGVGAGFGNDVSFGSITLNDTAVLRLPDGVTELLDDNTAAGPAGAEINVGPNARIEGSVGGSFGQLSGDGQIDNQGTITLPGSNVGVAMFDHNYRITFDNGASADANPGDQSVFAETFTAGTRAFPADPTPPTGATFVEWNTAADGTGTAIDATTALPGGSADGALLDIPLFARYTLADPNLTIVGTPKIGETLSATFDPQDAAVTPSFQWQEVDGPTVTDIGGATSATYVPAAGQTGKLLRVRLTLSADGTTDRVETADTTIVVVKGDQTITFTSTAPTHAVVDGTDYTVTATGGDSGNPVTFTIASASTSVCSISGSTVSFDATGTCTIQANQAGNDDYNPATQATQDVTVAKTGQTITFTSTAPTHAVVDGTDYTVTATGGDSGNPVTFTIASASTSVCSISGSTVSFDATGTCTIQANQAGNDDYNPATQATQDVTVAKTGQTITFTSTAPTHAVVDGTDYTVTATGGDSGNPVTFTIASASTSVCSISGSTVSFDATGTCTIQANQAGNDDYNPATQATQDVTVAKTGQTITFTSTAPTHAVVDGTDYTVTATGGDSGNPVTFTIASASTSVCSISGSTVSFDATGTCTIQANQAGNDDYNPATQATQDVTVAKTGQTITFTSTAPTHAVVDGTDYTVTATGGDSGNPVTFTIASASTSVCSISGSTVSFDATGTCTIQANQAGNDDYNPATQATQDVTVAKTGQTITFTSTAPTHAVVDGTDYTVTATGGDSGNPVTFTIASASTSVCSISGSTVSFDATGTCTIQANQAGNDDYNPATQATQDVTVAKTGQTITFTSTAPTHAVVDGTDYTVTATGGDSGNPVTFTIASASTSICSISGSTVSFDATGTCTIQANQAGNDDYNPATQATQDVTVAKTGQTITFTSTAPTHAVVDGTDYTVTATGGDSGNPVTFTIASASTSVCSISGSTVSFDATGTCTIQANQAGNDDYNPATQATQAITVRSAGVVVTVVDASTSEANAADTAVIRFSLTARPTGVVTIPITISDSTEGTAAGSVSIDPDDWDDPAANELTITSVDDDLVDGDITFSVVTGNPTSSDAAFDALVSADVDDVDITNVDDDSAGIVFDVTDDSVTDNGATATIEVALTARPSSEVTIPVTISDSSEGTAAASITVQAADWNDPAANVLTITGVADGVRDGDQTFVVSIGDPTSSDDAFDALDATAVAPATITSIDTDRIADVGISTSGELTLAAGGDTSELRFTVTNDGGDDAEDVTVDVILPAGVTLSSSDDAASLTRFTDCTSTTTGALCDLGTVAGGASVDVTIGVRVADPSRAPSVVSAAATVSTTTADADSANDEIVGSIRIVALADLTMTVSPVPTGTSTSAGFDVTVSNAGPSVSADNTIDFILPGGVTLATVPLGCAVAGQAVSCVLGSMAPDTSVDLAVRLVGNTNVTSIEVTLSSDADDPTPAGSTQTVTVPVFVPATTVPPTPTPPTTGLPQTGGQSLGQFVPLAGFLLFAGIAVMMLSRRRNQSLCTQSSPSDLRSSR